MRVVLETTEGIEIPLKEIETDILVIDQIAQFTIIQTYINNEDNAIETIYSFPTPAYSAVYDFSAEINERIIKCIVKEKSSARQEYQKAVDAGYGAYYMERNEGDIFTCQLGNVPAHTEVKITIKFVTELQTEINFSRVRLDIPVTIMDRYITTKNDIIENINTNKIHEKPYDMTIKGHIFMTNGIININSNMTNMNDMVINKINDNTSDFKIDNIQNLNKMISIIINRNKPISHCMIEDGQALKLTTQMYRYMTVINIISEYDISKIEPKHYVLILDKSGSMEGKPMQNCINASKIFVENIEESHDITFDIMTFNREYDVFTSNNITNRKQEAMAWLDNIKCTGGTEITPVLSNAYELIKNKNKKGVIIFLSDGAVDNVDEILGIIRSNPNVNVFTIGLGDDVSCQLIHGMAFVGNGKAEFIANDDVILQDKIMVQYRRSKCVNSDQTKIKIETDGPYIMVPNKMPPIFSDDSNMIYIMSENEITSVEYKNSTLPIIESNYDGFPLHRIIGYKALDMNEHDIDPIDLSINLGILCDSTAFVGVEIRDGEQITHNAQKRYVPLQENMCYIDDICCCSCEYTEKGTGASTNTNKKYSEISSKITETLQTVQTKTKQIKENISQKANKLFSFLKNISKNDKTDFEITVPLPSFVKSGNTLAAKDNGRLPIPENIKINVGDYVIISNQLIEDINGIYQIINIGSDESTWILQKIIT